MDLACRGIIYLTVEYIPLLGVRKGYIHIKRVDEGFIGALSIRGCHSESLNRLRVIDTCVWDSECAIWGPGLLEGIWGMGLL